MSIRDTINSIGKTIISCDCVKGEEYLPQGEDDNNLIQKPNTAPFPAMSISDIQ
jgi:hypothetical protein